MTKHQLKFDGEVRIGNWCFINNVSQPRVEESGEPELFGTCAYYRDGVIHIQTARCAAIGTAGRQWSYPGYVVDRTPYGVLCHELGHHVDSAHGAAGGSFGKELQQATKESAITGYAPNHNEWFAEMFRLFVTNPELLFLLRPLTYAAMIARWPRRSVEKPWEEVLVGAPRQIQAARNKIREAERKRR